MSRILVWDLPTRVNHWLLAGASLVALSIATTQDDDGAVFPLHMLAGLTVAALVLLRLVWGVVGSRYARFGSFVFGPAALLAYLRDALRRRAGRWIGHNPGASYAIYALLLLPLALASSGVAMATGSGRHGVLKELHEVAAYTLLAVIAAHIVGVIWHSVRHRENLPWSMIDGRKQGESSQAIGSARPLAGVVYLGLAAAWIVTLGLGYDAGPGQLRLPLVGQTLQLGHQRGADGEQETRERQERQEDSRQH